MNLRATKHKLKPDTALGMRDKDLTTQAITQDGRASQPDNTLLRQFCDCGNKATVKRGNAKICQRCADIDSKSPPYVVGKRRYWGAPTQTVYAVRLGGFA
jgi:hypothetical protein